MFQNSRTLDILLERFQCTPLGPKLTFWVFSHHFGALQRPFGFVPHTLGQKFVFWVVSCHFVAAPDPLWKSISGASNARVYSFETISCSVATNMPNPRFQSKTHVLGGSMPFCSRTWHVAKTGIEALLMHEFMALEPFLVFLQYRGAFKARVCASETISCLVATNMLNPQLRSKTHVYNSAWYLNALFT